MRVVVVDDVPRARFLVVSVVNELGYEVVAEASDGVKGVAAVKLHKPDVVVMDFHMPLMDGLDATAAIKQHYPEVAVIAFTSTDDPAIREQFLAAGACEHVAKGDLAHLTEALRRCADRESENSTSY